MLRSLGLLVVALTACGNSEKGAQKSGGASGAQGQGGSGGGGADSGGSIGTGGDGVGGSAGAVGSSEAGAAGAPTGGGGEGGATVVGAGGAAGSGGSDDPFLSHCALAQVDSGSVCLENVIAHAGDQIDVEIWLLLPQGCEWSTQFSVTFDYDVDNLTFEPDPIEDFYDGPYQCVLTPDQTPGRYALLKLSSSAESNCPEQFTPGLHAILRATVAAGAPAGDYGLTIFSENVGDNLTQAPVCRSQLGQMHWDGIVRIAP